MVVAVMVKAFFGYSFPNTRIEGNIVVVYTKRFDELLEVHNRVLHARVQLPNDTIIFVLKLFDDSRCSCFEVTKACDCTSIVVKGEFHRRFGSGHQNLLAKSVPNGL